MSKLTAVLTGLLASALLPLATPSALAGNLIDLQVVGRSNGQAAPIYYQNGKTYVVGAPGERYSVRLINRSSGRLLAVLSVDGVNAITGETASGQQSGYVLGPYETTEITGWRKSEGEVARFYFTNLADSYAARTDRPGNVGVIGVAAYREQAQPVVIATPYPQPMARPDNLNATGKNSAAVAVGKSASSQLQAQTRGAGPAAPPPPGYVQREESHLGTGHGERESSQISYTDFRRASSAPAEVVSVWYDSYQQLAARGIIPQQPPARHEPQAFPNQFVADPKH